MSPHEHDTSVDIVMLNGTCKWFNFIGSCDIMMFSKVGATDSFSMPVAGTATPTSLVSLNTAVFK